MDSLFPIEPKYPDGFKYFPDFLNKQEEKDLIDEIYKIELHPFIFQGFEAKRKVASFGFDYNFEKRNLSKGHPIPNSFDWLRIKVSELLKLFVNDITELLITEYPVGSVINWHRDAPPFDIIVGISLLADCNFLLRPHEKEKRGRSSIIKVPVKRRSLYTIQGSARTEWQHSIAAVKELRYSITLRTLR